MFRKIYPFVFTFSLLLPIFINKALLAQGSKEDIVMIAGFTAFDREKGVPVGWEMERKTGRPVMSLVKEKEQYYLHLISDEASFGIKKEITVDIKTYPFLNWTWKVKKLPIGGDVREADKDDQAIQIYLAFPSLGFPARLNTPVIGYIWDTEAPKGWQGRSQQMGGGKLRYIVIRNKSDRLDEWYQEKRNVYQDYKRLFKDIRGGELQGPVQGISFYINSQYTKSQAESYIGGVYFSRR